MEWIMLIEMIIKMIQECREDRDRDDIEKRLRNPGILEAWALRKALKENTELRGRALAEEVRASMDYLADMDNAEIGAFLDTIPGMERP